MMQKEPAMQRTDVQLEETESEGAWRQYKLGGSHGREWRAV